MLMALAVGLTLAPIVAVDTRDVTVGDLVRDARGRRLAKPMASIVVLRLPSGRRRMTLPVPAIAALVKRRVPSLSIGGVGSVTIVSRPSGLAVPACWTSIRAMQAGEAVTVRDAVPSPCGGATSAADIRYGGNAMPIIRYRIPAGASLGRLLPVPADRVTAGAALTLRSVLGPVTIERAVTTLQPGRSGRRVFVRDGDGQVFAATLALVEQLR